jgi:hypothetical protein
MKVEQLVATASEYFNSRFDFTKLTSEEKSKLAYGYTVQEGLAVISFYIPGTKPQDGKILAEASLDRKTGTLVDYKENS